MVETPEQAEVRRERDRIRKRNDRAREKEQKQRAAKAVTEQARPLSVIWQENRAALRASDPARYKELDDIDTELSDIRYWVRNVEDGVKAGLQPGEGWQDSDFNPDGTFIDENKPTMVHPVEVLAQIRAARAKYGDIGIDILMLSDEVRQWSDFQERRAHNKEMWDYGFLKGVPLDTEWRVLEAIVSLMRRGDVFDKELAAIADKHRPQSELPNTIKVSCACGRASEVLMPITDMQRLQATGQPYRCELCAKELAARLEDHREHMETQFYTSPNAPWGFKP